MALEVGQKMKYMSSTEVLYVPGLGANLISCGELNRVGISCVFYAQECLLEDIRSQNAVIGRASRQLKGI